MPEKNIFSRFFWWGAGANVPIYRPSATPMTDGGYDAWRCVDAGSAGGYVEYKSRVGHQLTDVCSNTGVWLTVTFTVERYISVCFPMKAIVWCTPKRARHIILAVCVCAAFLTLPEFFATTAAQVLSPPTPHRPLRLVNLRQTGKLQPGPSRNGDGFRQLPGPMTFGGPRRRSEILKRDLIWLLSDFWYA